MVFIRPTIIRDDTRMGQLSERKYSYIRAQQIEQRQRGISLRRNDTVPVLPEWGDDADLPLEYQRFLDEWRRETEELRREAERGGQ